MDLETILAELNSLCKDNKLTLSYGCAGHSFDDLLDTLQSSELFMTVLCKPEINNEILSFSGKIKPGCFIAEGLLSISMYIEGDSIKGDILFSCTGNTCFVIFLLEIVSFWEALMRNLNCARRCFRLILRWLEME